jgi:tetratricopeptide (TPR) repeat protein
MKRFAFAIVLLLAGCGLAQNPPQPQADNDPPYVKQARELLHDGKTAEALTVYQNELKSSPESVDANIGAGSVLDLMQRGSEARKYFEKAISSAKTDDEKIAANRAMAMSWTFDSNCQMTVMNQQKALDVAKAKNDYTRAAELANEEARACLDGGDIETGMVWYEEGHKLALQQPNLADAQKDLWNFRMENAAARIAVRINEDEDPWKHVKAAKAILDKGNIPQQQPFFPYLVGYVAYYQHDYKKALENFQQANQNDPYIQCMLAQTYEALGDKDHATEFYKKALASATGHNPASAYALRVASKKLH